VNQAICKSVMSEIKSLKSEFDWLNRSHWMAGHYNVLKRKQERRLIALAERIEYLHRLKSAVWSVKQNNND